MSALSLSAELAPLVVDLGRALVRVGLAGDGYPRIIRAHRLEAALDRVCALADAAACAAADRYALVQLLRHCCRQLAVSLVQRRALLVVAFSMPAAACQVLRDALFVVMYGAGGFAVDLSGASAAAAAAAAVSSSSAATSTSAVTEDARVRGGVVVVRAPPLCMMASARQSGLVVELGERDCSVVPVVFGASLEGRAVVLGGVGARAVLGRLYRDLVADAVVLDTATGLERPLCDALGVPQVSSDEAGRCARDDAIDAAFRALSVQPQAETQHLVAEGAPLGLSLAALRNILARCCFVAPPPELRADAAPSSAGAAAGGECEFALSARVVLRLPPQARWRCYELLFSATRDAVGESSVADEPLHVAIMRCVRECEAHVRSACLKAVQLCGGLGSTPGLLPRLHYELGVALRRARLALDGAVASATLGPEHVKYARVPFPVQNCAWFGASALANLNTVFSDEIPANVPASWPPYGLAGTVGDDHDADADEDEGDDDDDDEERQRRLLRGMATSATTASSTSAASSPTLATAKSAMALAGAALGGRVGVPAASALGGRAATAVGELGAAPQRALTTMFALRAELASIGVVVDMPVEPLLCGSAAARTLVAGAATAATAATARPE